jgi:membrane protease YdiL (CAAX protease family)
MSAYLLAWPLLNLFWVGGIQGLQETAETVPLWIIALQALVFCLFAFVGVGLFTRRSWKLTLVRLGLARIPRRSLMVAAASVTGLLMVNLTVSIIWILVNPEQVEAIGQISEVLLGGVDSFGSIFLVAICSSVSEELLFRGAMQPRFGILFTSILFAFTHLQYAISPATLLILIIGIVLGVLRRRFGTWTAIFTHFGYNFSLLMLGLIATKVLESVG